VKLVTEESTVEEAYYALDLGKLWEGKELGR
jgi:hypothetical protein